MIALAAIRFHWVDYPVDLARWLAAAFTNPRTAASIVLNG